MKIPTLKNQSPILVAGAGIGGLAAAIALVRKGWPVVLLEKSKQAPEEGAGIQLGPNGTRILHELGIRASLQHLISEPQGVRIMDGVSGSLLSRLPLGQSITEQFGSPYWVLHRADLHRALRTFVEDIKGIHFQTNSEVVDAADEPEGVIAYLRDGRHVRGSALIAADGLWSNVREQIFERKPLKFSGKCAFRAIISSPEFPDNLDRTDTTIWLRPSSHIVHYPIRGGREIAITAIFDDQTESDTGVETVDLESLLCEKVLFPSPLQALLAKPLIWRRWSLYSLDDNRPWVSQRIALLGDAAHPMLPFLAQGAVMALEDAVVLADVLDEASNSDVPRCLEIYERTRRGRVERVQKTSAQNGRIYHYDGILRVARNLSLRVLPPSSILTRYKWVYAWRANNI